MKQRTFLSVLSGVILALAGAFALAGCAGGQELSGNQLDAAIRETSDYLNGRLATGVKVVFLNVASDYPYLSDYIINQLIANTVNDECFTAVDRQNLALIQKEMDFQLSGEVSDDTAQSIGHKLGAQAIVSGSISPLGDLYLLSVRAIGVEGAEIQGQFNRDIPKGPRIAALTQNRVQPAPVAVTPAARIERPVPDGFVRIEGGTFTMGSPTTEVDRSSSETQHQVTVGGFYMGKYEVNQAEYESVTGTNPSYFKETKLPVENISWYEAIEYCNKRSEKEGLSPAYTINKVRIDTNNSDENDVVKWQVTWNKTANGYRLPTDAEWEYACRAGLTSPFNTGRNITTAQANYDGNYPYNGYAKGTYREKTTEVGIFAANRWGLYDMHGNVWEWCWDWYGLYPSSAQNNPDGAVSGVGGRVYRGGSWNNNGQDLRSAKRGGGTPSNRLNNLGFRLVRP